METRDFDVADEQSWLRCRVLGFLDTAYFDDVWPRRPAADIALVSVIEGQVVGLCDVSVQGDDATIDTVVVHPDHRRRGIASGLLAELLARLRDEQVASLDAWTREDPGTLDWYAASGFVVAYRYLHVYASGPEGMARAVTSRPGLTVRTGFFHVDTQDPDEEARLRRDFTRVHACHRLVRGV